MECRLLDLLLMEIISAALKKFSKSWMEIKKILLTGGAGYIGSNCNLLLDKFEVTVIDNLITGNKELVPKKAKLKLLI